MIILFKLFFYTYLATLVIITLYCMLQLQLLWKVKKAKQPDNQQLDSFPFVTVQLPIFNEMHVVERLIDQVAKLDYPKDRLEIHVLDDSTDETVNIVRRRVEAHRMNGIQIKQIRRSNRQGFKAGALRDGMALASGEFIAIFDADFMPKPDFLKKTIPAFASGNTAAVQTRWEHINEKYSLLTRLQALMLNVHFRVEQKGRAGGNYLLQFNGTAGVWRRSAIEDAGGWQADTLVEDLDLSMRAQLRGWKINYLDEVGTPAELPAEMNGLRSQQFRWMKGGAQVARKLMPAVWRSKLGFGQKLHATTQLLSSSIFPIVLLMGLTSLPVFWMWEEMQPGGFPLVWGLGGLAAFLTVQFSANVLPYRGTGKTGGRLLELVLLLPVFMAMMMGLALHNSGAVAEGWAGKQSPFVRTPKFNIRTVSDSFWQSDYLASSVPALVWAEGLSAVVFLAAAVLGVFTGNQFFIWLHMLLAFGFSTVFFYTLKHLAKHRRSVRFYAKNNVAKLSAEVLAAQEVGR